MTGVSPVPDEAVAIDRNDRDIIKAQLIRRIHGVCSISDFPHVAQADMALVQADDVIDIVITAALPTLREGIAAEALEPVRKLADRWADFQFSDDISRHVVVAHLRALSAPVQAAEEVDGDA